MKLWEIAHSRTGDKGNISNVSLIVYKAEDWERVRSSVTAEKVRRITSYNVCYTKLLRLRSGI